MAETLPCSRTDAAGPFDDRDRCPLAIPMFSRVRRHVQGRERVVCVPPVRPYERAAADQHSHRRGGCAVPWRAHQGRWCISERRRIHRTMGELKFFHHPYLLRGVAHTPLGNFTVVRGLIRVPEHIGVALGWATAERGTTDTPLNGHTRSSAAPFGDSEPTPSAES